MTSSRRYPFWTHDTVAAAVLAGVGMASLQTKLDGWASEINFPVVTACVRGWPIRAMFAGLLALIWHSVGGQTEKDQHDSELSEHEDESLRALSDAVGDGLDSKDEEEFGSATARVHPSDAKLVVPKVRVRSLDADLEITAPEGHVAGAAVTNFSVSLRDTAPHFENR
jgi:hypothetical protein